MNLYIWSDPWNTVTNYYAIAPSLEAARKLILRHYDNTESSHYEFLKNVLLLQEPTTNWPVPPNGLMFTETFCYDE